MDKYFMKHPTTEEISKLAALFDKCLSSEDPRIKSAFRELMILVALTEDTSKDIGILSKLIKDVDYLKARQASADTMGNIIRDSGSSMNQYNESLLRSSMTTYDKLYRPSTRK